MNKDLDHLFGQVRQSLKSDMPLKDVQQLIHAQASPSLWTNQKFWIMNTFIGIISISSLFLWNSYPPQNNKIAKKVEQQHKSTLTLLNKDQTPTSQLAYLQMATPDNLPLPIFQENQPFPIIPINPLTAKAFIGSNPTMDQLDSLGPKKNFTEYKLEIKKENSEREIKKLKGELASYGIHMEIKELSYNSENKIKRFKGKFKTDSLFCGSTMNDYEFDISGSFQKMEFIFRVSDNKNLKYLKIQSDDFEETIECYDDEVIANTQEAERMHKKMKAEMARARAEMTRAEAEMARASQEMRRASKEMEKVKEIEIESFMQRNRDSNNFFEFDSKNRRVFRFDSDNPVNWDDFNKNLKESLKNIKNIDHELITKEVEKALKKINKNVFDKEFKLEMAELKEEMDDLNYKIEIKVRDKIKAAKERQATRNHRFIEEREEREKREERVDNNRFFEEDASAKDLEEEAKALEKAAKELRKKAKKKAKKEKSKKDK